MHWHQQSFLEEGNSRQPGGLAKHTFTFNRAMSLTTKSKIKAISKHKELKQFSMSHQAFTLANTFWKLDSKRGEENEALSKTLNIYLWNKW